TTGHSNDESPLGPSAIGRIKHALELLMDPSQPIHHLLGPIEIFLPALWRPIGWRRRGHIAEVTNLVGELHQLRFLRQVGRMVDLQLFPSLLRETLIVCNLD